MTGYLSIVLHAHLPFVRHPEHDHFLEEMWLFEALAETYIPLLKMLDRFEDDGVEYGLLLSLSPTLLSMCEDELLQERFVRHVKKTILLAEREKERRSGDPTIQSLAGFYADFYRDALYWFEEKCSRRIAAAFRGLAAGGRLELMTCGATHAFPPIMQRRPGSMRAQIFTACEYHEKLFGVRPEGIWIPECAYYVGLEKLLAEAGIRYTFLDTHGIECASEPPRYGVYAPIYADNGVAFFGRDRETGHQVWAAEQGYPGHPDYREFYRDLGYELPEEDLRDFLVAGTIRVNTGIKYRRITGKVEQKDFYIPGQARQRAAIHAADFVEKRRQQVRRLAPEMDRPPLVVAPYDAELFGHWWFEGPWFLDYVFRKLCYDQNEVKAITPRKYLREFPENQVATPAGSSWGGDGTYEFWVSKANEQIIPELQWAADRMASMASRLAGELSGGGGKARVLRQMMRELMLAQASDWPFIMRTGTSPDYAKKRVGDHLGRFWKLESMLNTGTIDLTCLSAMEYADNIFPDCDPRLFIESGLPQRKSTIQ